MCDEGGTFTALLARSYKHMGNHPSWACFTSRKEFSFSSSQRSNESRATICVPNGLSKSVALPFCFDKVKGGNGGEERPRGFPKTQIALEISRRTNPGTRAEPQQIVAQGYSHAYSTPFHS